MSNASDTFPMQCSAIKKNMHCVMKGHPCKVIETSTSKVRALLLLLPLFFLLLALALAAVHLLDFLSSPPLVVSLLRLRKSAC